MVAFMKKIAIKNKLDYQLEVLTAGGTDTSGIQRMGKNGSIAGAISIPTRHIHQVIEMANRKDIKLAIELLCQCLNEIGNHEWEF